MAQQKYAIAYCAKSRQLYRLKLAEDGHSVTSFTLTKGNYSVTSVRNLPVLTTCEDLRACPRCGTRKVCGCDCLRTLVTCENGIGYRFPCIYCNQLIIVKHTG